ncbi:TPA: polymer-forming cytoskeletal protein, partial [Streptococcus suis]|nr:polymer-forming cytoskeletal protein [Streptococcus suis]
MTKKYELVLDDTISFWGWKLFRIRALISFGSIEVGDLGGYIEKEENLSHDGNAWVYGDA